MGFSVARGMMLAALLGLAACSPQPGGPLASANVMERNTIVGSAWMVYCISLAQLPPEQRRSCRAELNLSTPGQTIQAQLVTLYIGQRWTIRTNLPISGATVQVLGQPNAWPATCQPSGMCNIDGTAAQQLTQEIQAGTQIAVTLMTAQGALRSQVALAGAGVALRVAAERTSPLALSPTGPLTR